MTPQGEMSTPLTIVSTGRRCFPFTLRNTE